MTPKIFSGKIHFFGKQSAQEILKNAYNLFPKTDSKGIKLNMKTSSSKLAISTSPDNHCSLYNIKYYIKLYQNVWLVYFISFYKIICNCNNNWCFYKNLHLHLSEAIGFLQKPPSPY